MAAATETAWEAQIIEQLGNLPDEPGLTHAVVYLPAEGANDEVDLLDRCEGATAALVSAEDWSTKITEGSLVMVVLDDLMAWRKTGKLDYEHFTTIETVAAEVEPLRQNVETEEPARELETPAEEEDEPEVPPAPEPAPGEQAAAFEPSDYEREDLQIPRVDGQTVDRISLKFSGEVFLDRSDPSDVAVYNALRLGRDVQLLVEAKCGSTGAKGETNREGNLDVVVGTKGLKVHSLRKPAGADWVQEA